ncbi:MAG: twin-arginine translocase TatA/TatE family subunit [Anaerolineales bacterium]
MPNFGPTELIIILIIAVLLFGVGRLGRLGGELGRGIREFRRGIQEDEPNDDSADVSADISEGEESTGNSDS